MIPDLMVSRKREVANIFMAKFPLLNGCVCLEHPVGPIEEKQHLGQILTVIFRISLF